MASVTAPPANWKVMVRVWCTTPVPALDELELQARQRPIGHGLRRFNAVRKGGGDVAGRSVQLQARPVVVEPPARRQRPAEGIFPFLDVLVGGVALIVELHAPVCLHGQVGNDEAHEGEQRLRMPLDLRHHVAFSLLALRFAMEILAEVLDPGLRELSHQPGQTMCDFLPQHRIGGQPNCVETACHFEVFIDHGKDEGGIGTKESHEITPGITGDHWVRDLLPAICAIDAVVVQGAGFEHPELVEQRQRVVTLTT